MKNAEEKLKGIYKRQNEHIAEHYDRVNAILPKGYKERIRATGQTLNAFITQAVKAELERLEEVEPLADPWQDLTPADDPLARVSAVPASVPAPSLEELQEMLNAKREERTQLPEEIRHPEPEEIEEEPATPEPVSVTDTPGLSIRELAERAKQTVREEAEKREAARQKSEAESAVAEMLKNRS